MPPSAEVFARAADAELRYARPLPGNAYKVTLARNLITSVVEELAPAGGAVPDRERPDRLV